MSRHSLHVAMITGSFPPDVCGVGDYTACLVDALRSASVRIDVLTGCNWNALQVGKVAAQVRKTAANLIHIQYPTLGYAKALGPQALSQRMRAVVTVHDFSNSHPLRRAAIYPFFLSSRYTIFTTDAERKFAMRFAPWLASKSCVIPIGSNIAVQSKTKNDSNTIVYFGLLRSGKGIEDFIELARLCSEMGLPYTFKIIGRLDSREEVYIRGLQTSAKEPLVKWLTELKDNELSAELSGAFAAYLPFPDGASERRGSLLAALAHGVPTISKPGFQTSLELSRAILRAADPNEALSQIVRLATEPDLRKQMEDQGREYSAGRSWDAIAVRHIDLYNELVSRTQQQRIREH